MAPTTPDTPDPTEAAAAPGPALLVSHAVHRRVATRAADLGVLSALPCVVVDPATAAGWPALGTFVSGWLLVTGVFLYLATHFVGAELFEAGRRAAFGFTYLNAFALSGTAATVVTLAPRPLGSFGLFVIAVSAAGLRWVVDGGAPFGA